MAGNVSNLRLFRNICSELRHLQPQVPVNKQSIYSYIRGEFRDNRITQQKYCRGDKEMQHMGQTYLCLLESVRKHQELLQVYQGKGDRSTEEAANLVGLTLPVTDAPQ